MVKLSNCCKIAMLKCVFGVDDGGASSGGEVVCSGGGGSGGVGGRVLVVA